MNTEAHLNYNIAEMKLTGRIGSAYISCLAYCGGRGGSTTPGASNNIITNNPFLTGLKYVKGEKDSVGGPLPQGWYTLKTHGHKLNMIRLVPGRHFNMQGRDGGFLIHKRGPIGSQGCIVPESSAMVEKLYKLVKSREVKKKAPVSLHVFAVGDLDYYLAKLNTV